VTWGFYTVRGRRQVDPPVTGTAMQAVFAMLVTVPIAAATGDLHLDVSAAAFGSLVYIALGASVAAMILWNYGVVRTGPNAAGASLNLLPVFTAAIAAVLGAPLVPVQFIGGALVLVGMWFVTGKPAAPPGAADRADGVDPQGPADPPSPSGPVVSGRG